MPRTHAGRGRPSTSDIVLLPDGTDLPAATTKNGEIAQIEIAKAILGEPTGSPAVEELMRKVLSEDNRMERVRIAAILARRILRSEKDPTM